MGVAPGGMERERTLRRPRRRMKLAGDWLPAVGAAGNLSLDAPRNQGSAGGAGVEELPGRHPEGLDPVRPPRYGKSAPPAPGDGKDEAWH